MNPQFTQACNSIIDAFAQPVVAGLCAAVLSNLKIKPRSPQGKLLCIGIGLLSAHLASQAKRQVCSPPRT